jgi:hypothetical protein
MAAAEIKIFFVHLNPERVTESGRLQTTPNDDMNECVEWIQNTTSQPVGIEASPFFYVVFVVVSKQRFDIWNLQWRVRCRARCI